MISLRDRIISSLDSRSVKNVLDTSEDNASRLAALNSCNDEGYTPLLKSCSLGSALAITALLKSGADPNMTSGDIPLDCAFKGRHEPFRFTDQQAAPIHLATAHGIAAVRAITDSPIIDLNARSAGGWTAVGIAAYRGQEAVLKYLIGLGPQVDVNAADNNGHTPLMYAAQRGKLRCVKVLLAIPSVDVNATRSNGATAVTLAAEEGHRDVLKALHTAGADIDHPMNGGIRPLHLAAQEGHIDCVELLCGYGADRGAKDDDGDTALSAARRWGNNDTANYLEGLGAVEALEAAIGYVSQDGGDAIDSKAAEAAIPTPAASRPRAKVTVAGRTRVKRLNPPRQSQSVLAEKANEVRPTIGDDDEYVPPGSGPRKPRRRTNRPWPKPGTVGAGAKGGAGSTQSKPQKSGPVESAPTQPVPGVGDVAGSDSDSDAGFIICHGLRADGVAHDREVQITEQEKEITRLKEADIHWVKKLADTNKAHADEMSRVADQLAATKKAVLAKEVQNTKLKTKLRMLAEENARLNKWLQGMTQAVKPVFEAYSQSDDK